MDLKISVLGSTGSIGTQTLEIAREHNIKIESLTANKNIELLEKQIREFNVKKVCVFDEEYAKKLKENIKDLDCKVLTGIEGLCEAGADNDSDIVVTAVVGMIGLLPTLECIKNKKNIALANKETLVTAGEIVMNEAEKNGVKILPVDSEHGAIFQCLQGNDRKSVSKIILTASGGPFFGKDKEYLKNVTKAQALNHPNWAMGNKITIDSATLMNKGLEFIEAKWLFDVEPEQIDIVVHRESVIHSMVEYCDGSVIAQLGAPDMKLPIQYALTYPERHECFSKKLDIIKYGQLSFYAPDEETFSCLAACKKAIKIDGTMPSAVNGANEAAVSLFLNDKIKFFDIFNLVDSALNNHKAIQNPTLNDILEADKWARNHVFDQIK